MHLASFRLNYSKYRDESPSKLCFRLGTVVFTALLVVVGFLQVWLLNVTWKTIERQTRLLNFSQQQWVDIAGWRVDGDEEEELHEEDSKLANVTRTIDCTFEVFNNSNLPITLRRVITNVGLMGMNTQPRSYEVTENLTLPPHPPARSFGYVTRVPIVLNEEAVSAYLADNLFVFFLVEIFFLDADGNEKPQSFQQLARLKPGKIELWRPAGAVPEEIPYRDQQERLQPRTD